MSGLPGSHRPVSGTSPRVPHTLTTVHPVTPPLLHNALPPAGVQWRRGCAPLGYETGSPAVSPRRTQGWRAHAGFAQRVPAGSILAPGPVPARHGEAMLTSSQHKTLSARDSRTFLPLQPYSGCSRRWLEPVGAVPPLLPGPGDSPRPGSPDGSARHIPSLARAMLAPGLAAPRRCSPLERTDCSARMPTPAGDGAGIGQHVKRPRSPSPKAADPHSTASPAAVLVHTEQSHHAQQIPASLHLRLRYSNEQRRQEVPPPMHDEPVPQERLMPPGGSRAPVGGGPVS